MGRWYAIQEMPPDERPRERLINRGPASLKNDELVAILLNTGIKGEPVTSVAQRLLLDHGGFVGLMRLDVKELAQVRGLGTAKAATIKAAMEIANRVLALGPDERPQIAAPDDVINLVGLEMSALEQEQLRVVMLDTKHRVTSIKTLYQGSVNQAQVRISEIFRPAVQANAVAIILVHNHPSGDPTPSAADVALTIDLIKAGELLGIDVLDHLVVGRGRHASLRRLGLAFGS